MSDILTRYQEFRDFENSPAYKNTKIGTALLSNKFDIGAGELTSVLKSKYSMSDGECTQVLKNLSNHKDVDMRIGTFDKVVKLRRR